MRALLFAALFSLPAHADAPKVLADIPPVASLLAQVMKGVAEPKMIADPSLGVGHSGALRPSDSRRLAQAELVVWIGPEFSPWLETPIDRIAEDATIVNLARVDGLVERAFRDVAVFAHEGHDHDDDHADGDEDRATHDDAHDHAHGDVDLHYWLDPVNGVVWVRAMAAALSELDPENAETYAANAEAAAGGLRDIEAQITSRLDGLSPRFMVAHDSLRHFEDRFGLEAVAALSDSHAAAPGPRRVAEVRAAVETFDVSCLLVEPGETTRMPIEAVDLVEIDPLGLRVPEGPDLYAQVLLDLAEAIARCGGE